MPTTHPAEAASARDNPNAVLAAICLVLAVALPLLVGYYLATAPAHVLAGHIGLPESSPLGAPGFRLSALQRVIVMATGLAPVACMAVALIYARRCFRSFSRREYFTLGVVRGLRGCAGAIFFSGVSGLLVAPLASVLLSAVGGGQLSLTLSLGSSQVLLLLFAGIVWQISAVMARAVVLAEEHSQFV
jgi:hypothetical protein